MDRMTQERYGPLTADDLEAERWPWRGKPITNTPQDIARRRRQLWLAFQGTVEDNREGHGRAEAA